MVTLVIEDMEKLPQYSSEMPITIKHLPGSVQHMVEKTVTLNVDQSRSFSFVDSYGEEVQCYINNVKLIDVWKDTEKQFNDPRYTEKVSAEQLQEIKDQCYEALEQSCPKGIFMRLKPDKETGAHNLPLRGYVIQTAVSPDTTKIPAELLFYMEKVDGWEEKV